MRFEWPLALLALLLVPLLLAGSLVLERRRARYAVVYTNIDVLAQVAGGTRRLRTYLPLALLLLALTSALAALSRPRIELPQMREQASIVLAVDTSGSMAADDVKPTRLAAAEQAIGRFLTALPRRYRIGLVTFSSEPRVASPLTWSRDQVRQALAWAGVPGKGTAIGDALGRSLRLLQPTSPDPSNGPLSAIVLLSDGAQTRGTLAPLQGAARAVDAGVPVYTVALGTPTGTIREGVISLPVPPDAATLGQIASATGGQAFAPPDEARLDAVYEHLASQLGRTMRWRELADVLVGLAALLALGAGACALWVRDRLP
jgi:Ca-activated chloride channel family protein